jgi:thiol-disulfide isomerase/thioredoxin
MMLALVSLLLAATSATTVKLDASGSARVGAPAPSFGGWDLKTSQVLTLDGLRHKPQLSPLLITFGASWCHPCREGLPRLIALAKKHPELRLVLIDVVDDGETAQAWAGEIGLTAPAILDKFGNIAKTYGLDGGGGDKQSMKLPRTFLVDASGRVRAIYREEGTDLEQVIEADLEAAKSPVRPAATDAK